MTKDELNVEIEETKNLRKRIADELEDLVSKNESLKHT